jgi:hypothetical protein
MQEMDMETKLIDLKEGDKLVADGGFTCLNEGQIVEVKKDAAGELYVPCRSGRHALDGQTDDGETLVGLEKVS